MISLVNRLAKYSSARFNFALYHLMCHTPAAGGHWHRLLYCSLYAVRDYSHCATRHEVSLTLSLTTHVSAGSQETGLRSQDSVHY